MESSQVGQHRELALSLCFQGNGPVFVYEYSSGLYMLACCDSFLNNRGEMLVTQSWLPLMEYSAKYRVSMSTLRRRIKSGEMEYKLTDGKYLLKDGPFSVVPNTSKSAPGSETIAPPISTGSQNQESSVRDSQERTVQALLSEIKKAYTVVLQAKEEQILQLKEEVADLKTLVRVLEDENNRLRGAQAPSMDFDLGLEA